MISETLSELMAQVSEAAYVTKDKQLKAEKTKKCLEVTLPKGFTVLENKVQGKFFLGDKASYADVQLFLVFGLIKEPFPNADMSEYKKLLAVSEQVKSNPGVAAYLASRAQW